MNDIVYLAAAPVAAPGASQTAHALLNRLYEQVTGSPAPALLKQPRGKPYFASGPWHCSITHTKTMAFCALSPCPIGMDAEPMDRTVMEKTAKRVLSPREYAVYEAQKQTFPTFWTLKEAYVKYTGEGIGSNLQQLSFVQGPEGWRLEESDLFFSQLVTKQHFLSVCTSSPVKLQFVTIDSQ